jgi:GT2 family glycosyltransferase
MQKAQRIVIVIASVGRPDDIADQLAALKNQTRKPDGILLSVTEQSDLPPRHKRECAEVIFSPKGLCAQRNAALEHIGNDYDILAFFDDDYLPTKTVVEGIDWFFKQHQDVVGATGYLIADGIKGPGIKFDEAMELIEKFEKAPAPKKSTTYGVNGLYGCNMAFRVSKIKDCRFDENLPFYGWQEDVDFANRMAREGKLAATNAFSGVHRGTKRSRSPGLKLGYSQIANVIYLMRKGTMPVSAGMMLMTKNFVANHARYFFPEKWVDRKGRTAGNWLALRDYVSKRLDPRKIFDL